MIKLKAYAKINLSLRIIKKRDDGYHQIESIMQSISLCDLLTLSKIGADIQFTTNNSQLTTDSRNLAYRAAELFFNQTKIERGIRVHLQKNIPIAAGLAGGSADAAAVLYGLNKMTNDVMTDDELIKLGAQIGSDVPFCLVGGRCQVEGRGELITKDKLPVRPTGGQTTNYYILVVPDFQVSSKWAYEQYDKILNPKSEILNKSQIPKSKTQNDLEAIVMAKYPVIKEIKDRLLELGCQSAQMSGSGPAVFGAVKNHQFGQKILEKIKKEYARSFLVESVERGVEIC